MRKCKQLNFNFLKNKKAYHLLYSTMIFAATHAAYSQKKLTASLYVDDAALSLTGDEFPEQIAVDKVNKNEEDVYVIGASFSPAKTASFTYCDTMRTLGNGDAFLTKYEYNPNSKKMQHKWGSNLKYTGTAGDADATNTIDRYDWAYCLTVDHEGSETYIYVGGASLASTQSMFCKTCNTSPAFQPAPADEWDGFIAKYDAADGSLIAFTYFGGNDGRDEVLDIAVKPGDDHDVYVVGYTESDHLGLRAAMGYDRTFNSGGDGFIAGFNNCLTQLKYYTYYTIDSAKSPSGQDRCHCLKFNADGSELYISGTTDRSTEGIATRNVYQTKLGGGSDAFAAKWVLQNSAYVPLWGTYIGGDSLDRGRKLAITDPSITGATYVYVTGWTTSPDLKLLSGTSVIQRKPGGANDAFIVKLDGATGRGLWSTYFGGSGGDVPNGISWFYSKKTGAQYIAIAGITNSPDSINFIHAYTGSDKFKSKLSGDHDAFFAVFTDIDSGVSLNYATYLGGSGDENYGPPDCSIYCQCLVNNSYSGYGPSVASLPDGTGTAYVSFATNSKDVPDSLLNGDADGTVYNNGKVVKCVSCGLCTHDNYDAFFVRIDMGKDKKNPDQLLALDSEQSSALSISVSSNPFLKYTSLYIPGSCHERSTIIIYDSYMHIVSKKSLYIDPGQNKVDLNFSEFASGLYTIQVFTSEKRGYLKIVKQ